MEQRYFNDMGALLKGDARAWKFYNMLPDPIRARIQQESGGVHTFDGLLACASSLMGGKV